DEVLADFADYRPVTARDLGVSVPGAEFYSDFHVLSQCDHVAISNSSFSFAACMLNEQGRSFMRPDLKVGRLVEFDPWNSEPLQRDALAEDYGPPHMRVTYAMQGKEPGARPDSAAAPRVSVYITSYNQQDWLREAIDSVLSQSVMPHEIIIVDDASSDGSQALIETYRDRYPQLIKRIFHSRNQGIARTRIDALDAVTGDYVTYVDGDDRFLPDKLERELAALAAHPGAELVYSNFYFIDAEGKRTALWAEDTDVVHTGWIFPHVFARNFPKRTLFRNELVATTALRRTGLHDPELGLFEDFELRIRLTFGLEATYCDHPLAEYRPHPGSLSHADLREHLAALDYIHTKNASLLSILSAENRDYVTQAYQDWVAQAYLSRIEEQIAAAEADDDGYHGDNLIFVFAMPHAGADRLQAMLCQHLQLHALDAPGILSPLLGNLNFAADGTGDGQRTFSMLPDGEATYLHAARQFAGELYRRILTHAGKHICVDITAEYLEHAAALRRLLPKARFVTLLRHPAAVAAEQLGARPAAPQADRGAGAIPESLSRKPAELLNALAALGRDAIVVRYEDLHHEPVLALRRLCARLGLGVNQRMTDAALRLKQQAVHDSDWTRYASGTLRHYLESLGVDVVEGLGYAYRDALERLANTAPAAADPTGQGRAHAAIIEGEERFGRGDLDGAEKCFKTALELAPDDTEALNNLGVLHWQRGAVEQALQHFAQGLTIDPDDRSLVVNTVAVLGALQNNDDAVALCRAYLERHPDDDELRMQMDTLEAGDRETAVCLQAQ
ncbi:MAG: glycosyltransferase, partial [Thiohalobacteraceae bacterium]